MKRVMAVLLPVLLLTACAAPNVEGAYVSTVREGVPSLADAGNAELAGIAEQVCDLFDQQGFENGMAEFIRVAKNAGLTAKEAGTIAGAAAGAYCTEHADNF